jgi:hypothetical protein
MGGNMGLTPSKNCVEEIKNAFPEGAEVELVFMDDAYRTMPKGLKGKVSFVDGIGTIHVAWENGSGLGVVWNADVVKNIKTGALSSTFWKDNKPLAKV